MENQIQTVSVQMDIKLLEIDMKSLHKELQKIYLPSGVNPNSFSDIEIYEYWKALFRIKYGEWLSENVGAEAGDISEGAGPEEKYSLSADHTGQVTIKFRDKSDALTFKLVAT